MVRGREDHLLAINREKKRRRQTLLFPAPPINKVGQRTMSFTSSFNYRQRASALEIFPKVIFVKMAKKWSNNFKVR